MMTSVVTGYFISALVLLAATSAQILRPPIITNGPLPTTIYLSTKEGESQTLPCYVDDGPPRRRFEWKMDGRSIEGESGSSLTLQKTSAAGYYQCLVHTDEYGTAVSNVTKVVKAVQASFKQETNPTARQATVGASLNIMCTSINEGVPAPRLENYYWKQVTDSGERPYPTSKRVQVDEHGGLNFAAVTQGDIDFIGQCYIQNSILTTDVGGSKTKIVNSGQPAVAPQKPVIMFYSNRTDASATRGTVVGLEGQDVSLRCFFSGSERIDIAWRRADGVRYPTDHTAKHNSDSELRIKAAVESDEGVHICSGTNEQGTTDFEIQLYIYVAPRFESDADRPHNVDKSVGDDVTFHCKTRAKPAAAIQWYKNGVPIDPEKAAKDPKLSKFLWSNDLKTLTIEKLCKANCSKDHDPDMMVIQCNASNQFNYAFSNGYINVFEQTVFTLRPPKEVAVNLGDTLSLSAHAQSDPTTPVTYNWYRNDRILHNDGRIVILNGTNGFSGTNLTIYELTDDDMGHYECRASNGISTVASPTDVQTIGKTAALAAAAFPWWIFIVLVVIIITCCIVCVVCFLYQNRGEDYPVDETERKQGNNPEQDLEDADLKPFNRKEKDTGSETGSTISRSTLDRRVVPNSEETGLIPERRGSAGGTFD